MIYFKYKISFKKAKNFDKLLINQNIDYILDEDNFKKHQRNGDDIYCFIDPYCKQINEQNALSWGLSEEEAMNIFYRSADDV